MLSSAAAASWGLALWGSHAEALALAYGVMDKSLVLAEHLTLPAHDLPRLESCAGRWR